MHNSNNPAIGKVIFTGTLLAQAQLLGISTNTDNPNSTISELKDAIDTDTKLKVHVIPNFFAPEAKDSEVPKPLVNYLKKQSIKVRSQLEPYQAQLLDKAHEYGINANLKLDQDFSDYDFNSLVDEVYEWEDLLERANDLGVAWEESDYDVIGIEQEIESYEANYVQEQHYLYNDFLSSRAV